MKKTLIKKGIVFVIVLLFISLNVIQSAGRTEQSTISYGNIFYVGGSGPGNYSTIQEAVDNASEGDTVFVFDDSSPYYENIVVNKSINLIGEDRNTTVIDALQGEYCFYISDADGVNISGFSIRNTSIGRAGIDMYSNYSTIIGNNFSWNDWVGIRSEYSNYNNISGNFFYQNHDCIQLRYSDHNNITSNQCTYNYFGIGLSWDSHFNIISDNHIIGIGFSGRPNNDLIYIGDDCNNNTVINNIGSDSLYGIRSYGPSSGINISGNIINDCELGLSLPRISRSIIHGNWITNCDSYGIHSWRSNFTIFSGNIISGNFGDGLFFEDSFKNNTIFDNNINLNEGTGIQIEDSSTENNIFFNNNIILNHEDGILLRGSSHNNTIFDNNINLNKGHGVFLKDSAYDNIITHNNVSSNEGYGFYLKDFPNNNTISGNTVNSNIGHGFCLNDSSHDNTIIYNNVSLNNGYGIFIENGTTACYNNLLYRNNFINNTFGGHDECKNTWDNGYPSGGNYWSDYIGVDDCRGPYQNILGSDSIGDKPYSLDGGDNEDRYPLMYPWGEQRPVANYTYTMEYGGYIFNGSPSYDSDGVVLFYDWDFGDGTTSQEVAVAHGFNESGTYNVTLVVTDDDGYQGSYTMSIDAEKNHPPSAPSIDGPIEEKALKSHLYDFTSEDPDLADVSYYIEWGDGAIEDWSDFQPSGEPYSSNHGWAKGTYTIRCKSKDIYGAESGWGTLKVTMPKYIWFLNWLERFPILQWLLSFIIK